MNRFPSSDRMDALQPGLSRRAIAFAVPLTMALCLPCAGNCEQPLVDSAAASIDGTEPGWIPLTETDFENVNCFPDTWTWKGNAVQCSGRPIGVIRSKRQYANFE